MNQTTYIHLLPSLISYTRMTITCEQLYAVYREKSILKDVFYYNLRRSSSLFLSTLNMCENAHACKTILMASSFYSPVSRYCLHFVLLEVDLDYTVFSKTVACDMPTLYSAGQPYSLTTKDVCDTKGVVDYHSQKR